MESSRLKGGLTVRLNKQLQEKNKESLSSVLPITAIVFLLSISIAPLDPGTLVLFLFGAILLIGGMGFFTLGVDMSMTPMGEGVGVEVSRARHLIVPIVLYFLLGVLATVAEPDLQVLAEQVPSIDNPVLIWTVAHWCGNIPGDCRHAYPYGCPSAPATPGLLLYRLCPGSPRARQLYPRFLRLWWRHHWTYHSTVHHGPWRRYCLHPQR